MGYQTTETIVIWYETDIQRHMEQTETNFIEVIKKEEQGESQNEIAADIFNHANAVMQAGPKEWLSYHPV